MRFLGKERANNSPEARRLIASAYPWTPVGSGIGSHCQPQL